MNCLKEFFVLDWGKDVYKKTFDWKEAIFLWKHEENVSNAV